jgi:aspartate ammonia-lyase
VESSTASVTALLPALSYEGAAAVAAKAVASGRTIRATVLEDGILTAEELDQLLSPEAVTRLGSLQTRGPRKGRTDIL